MSQAVTGLEAIKAAMEKYGGGGGRTEFFKLANDGDSTVGRLLHSDDKDLNIYVVHKVKIQGKDRWVLCTKDERCPLCMAGNYPQLRMFLYLVDKGDGKKVKLWERGKKFIPTMLGLIAEYGNLNERDFKIVRNGAKGDTSTTYQFFPRDKSPEELPERPDVVGENGFVLEKSIEDLRKIADGSYQPTQAGSERANEKLGTELF